MGSAPRSRVRARRRANGAAPRGRTRPAARAEAALSRGRRRLPGDHRASAGRHRRRRRAGDRRRRRRRRARAAHDAGRGEVVPLRRGRARSRSRRCASREGAVARMAAAGDDRCSTARARRSRSRVELARDARFIGWDVICLGRTASGERYASGRLRQSLELVRDGALVFVRARGDRRRQSRCSNPVRSSSGAPVFGTFVAAGAPVADDAACGVPRRRAATRATAR